MSNKKNILLWDKFTDLVSNPGAAIMRDKKKALLALFLLAWAAGLYYPVAKILRFEFPWASPAIVRFNVGLYDPYDPFRGRYVAISTPRAQVTLARAADGESLDLDSRLYAVIEQDEKGMAKIVDLAEKPQAGKINLRLDRHSVYWRRNKDNADYDTYNVSLPFNRFYMNEKLAPEAERAFMRAASRGKSETCQIIVKIYRDGAHAIVGLEIEGMPIHEFLLKMESEKEETGIRKPSEKGAERVTPAEEADIAELPGKGEDGDSVIFVPD